MSNDGEEIWFAVRLRLLLFFENKHVNNVVRIPLGLPDPSVPAKKERGQIYQRRLFPPTAFTCSWSLGSFSSQQADLTVRAPEAVGVHLPARAGLVLFILRSRLIGSWRVLILSSRALPKSVASPKVTLSPCSSHLFSSIFAGPSGYVLAFSLTTSVTIIRRPSDRNPSCGKPLYAHPRTAKLPLSPAGFNRRKECGP